MRISNCILSVASACVLPVVLLLSSSALGVPASARGISGDLVAGWEMTSRADAQGSPAREDCIQFGNYQIINGECYAVEGGIWDFEDGADGPGQGGPSLQGWTPSGCPGIDSFFGVAPLGGYIIQDPVGCGLEGHIVHFHGPAGGHFAGQMETAWSPIVDRTSVPDYQEYVRISCIYDMGQATLAEGFASNDLHGGVWYRAGWSYYPFLCNDTGESIWSPRVGNNTWFHIGSGCHQMESVGTDWGLPPDCEMLRFGMDIFASCDAFGMNCDSVDWSLTPLFDNFRVLMCRMDNSAVPDAEIGGNKVARLYQNEPNPFVVQTTIGFSLARAGLARLTVHDVAGRKVRTLVDGHRMAGSHSVVWDGLDDSGRPVVSGVFWSQLAVDRCTHRHRMVILK